jgi:aspartate aminotransferase
MSDLANNLIGSEVLKIAGEIAELKKSGKSVFNFTVGDFDPKYFPIPAEFQKLLIRAIDSGETNYPPSSGISELRSAVAKFYSKNFEISVSPQEILIAGGARPLIFGLFQCLVNPGDTVIYPAPSWNNNHYSYLAGAKGIALNCSSENGFMPTLNEIKPYLKDARLFCLNSPLNPTGTTLDPATLKTLLTAIVDENQNRRAKNQRPLYLLYDQIYWMLTFNSQYKHPTPLALVPESKPYVVYVDGISKYFCATGLRVGWTLAPSEIIQPLSNFLGHVGAWAPKPEQVATAQFLEKENEIKNFLAKTKSEIQKRLETLYTGVLQLKAQGAPLDAVKPQGAIYLSLQIKDLNHPETNEAKRKRLLEKTGIAVVPFQAFGLKSETGWFRMSVGAVSEKECEQAILRLKDFY